MILQCLTPLLVVLGLSALQLSAQEPPTFRVDVELFLVGVQVRADRGVSLPHLAPADFVVRIGSRRPAVLHAVPIELTDAQRHAFPYDRMRWPKDEPAVVYQLSFHADKADCRQVPKVAFSVKHKGVKIRAVDWQPLKGCFPPRFDHLNR
jgi:hypothetical protein